MSAAAPAASGKPAVEMLGIRRHFPGVQALKGVDLKVERGEIHAMLGENGAGKSTLMRILAGAERKDGGRILLEGEEVRISDPTSALERGSRPSTRRRVWRPISVWPRTCSSGGCRRRGAWSTGAGCTGTHGRC